MAIRHLPMSVLRFHHPQNWSPQFILKQVDRIAKSDALARVFEIDIKALASPEIQRRFVAMTYSADSTSPSKFSEEIASEYQRWSKITSRGLRRGRLVFAKKPPEACCFTIET